MSTFKIGDWVINSQGNIKQLDESDIFMLNQIPQNTLTRELALWQPKEGEYCWNTAKRTIVHIRNIVEDQYGLSFGCYSEANGTSSAGYYRLIDLEPFIGTLPSFLKDTHETC